MSVCLDFLWYDLWPTGLSWPSICIIISSGLVYSHKDISSARNLFRGVNSLSVPDGGVPASTAANDDDDDDDDGHHVVRRNGQVTPGAPDKRNSVGSSVGSLDPEAPANYNYGRRRSRAVLYQLSGHYGQATDKKAHKKMHNKIPANVS